MGDLKEFWGMMNVLDSADDVAVFARQEGLEAHAKAALIRKGNG